jgi:hypothetical protein
MKRSRNVVFVCIGATLGLCLVALGLAAAFGSPNLDGMSLADRRKFYEKLDMDGDAKKIDALPERFQYEYWVVQRDRFGAEVARIERAAALNKEDLRGEFSKRKTDHEARMRAIQLGGGDTETKKALLEEEEMKWKSWRDDHTKEVIEIEGRTYDLRASAGGKLARAQTHLQALENLAQERKRLREKGYSF